VPRAGLATIAGRIAAIATPKAAKNAGNLEACCLIMALV
jgi:hypothetical protein